MFYGSRVQRILWNLVQHIPYQTSINYKLYHDSSQTNRSVTPLKLPMAVAIAAFRPPTQKKCHPTIKSCSPSQNNLRGELFILRGGY